jgi:hypothetical protein
VAALLLGVGLLERDAVALADVAAMRVAEIPADDLERQRVALHVDGELLALLLSPLDAERHQQFCASLLAQRREVALRRSRGVALQIGDRVARRHQAEAGVTLREALQQREHAVVLQLAGERRIRGIL